MTVDEAIEKLSRLSADGLGRAKVMVWFTHYDRRTMLEGATDVRVNPDDEVVVE